jgi:hypothetical protein
MSDTVPSALVTRERYAAADATAPDRTLGPVRLVLRWASLAMVAVMIALPAVQVVLREILNLPFIGAEELTRFMLICVVFVTSLMSWRQARTSGSRRGCTYCPEPCRASSASQSRARAH